MIIANDLPEVTVITLTKGNRASWLKETSDSVATDIFARIQYTIATCATSENFQKVRWSSFNAAETEYISSVDDDDILINNSISKCLKAIKNSGVGIAFTYVAYMNNLGEPLATKNSFKPISYLDFINFPARTYTAYVVRKSCLDQIIYDKALACGIGIDWILRAYIAAKYGAIVIPEIGIRYRIHDEEQLHKIPTHQELYCKERNNIRQFLFSQLPESKLSEMIPIYYATNNT